MKVCIIGWYGTETIGDRAILAGIISFLSQSTKEKEIQINLGALYPFYSERMVNEDFLFWTKITGKSIKINIFNSKIKNELEKNIENTDLVIMGGGPIMHMEPLYMVEYAFKYAKKFKKKTGVLGCGIGPLFESEYKKSTVNIIKNSDIIILRDEKSKDNLIEIFDEFKEKLDINKIAVSYDPAVKCALDYLNLNQKTPNETIVINLRSFPEEYSKNKDKKDCINNELKSLIKKIGNTFLNNKILLVPMHYFSVGSDDRDFLNKICLKSELSLNISVQNEILTLEETMEIFYNAKICIGMRFHSVVLQTILSKNNFVLDYTEPQKGKIIGFLNDIDENLKFYKNRYINLQAENEISSFILKELEIEKKFDYSSSKLIDRMSIYINKIKEVLNESSSY